MLLRVCFNYSQHRKQFTLIIRQFKAPVMEGTWKLPLRVDTTLSRQGNANYIISLYITTDVCELKKNTMQHTLAHKKSSLYACGFLCAGDRIAEHLSILLKRHDVPTAMCALHRFQICSYREALFFFLASSELERHVLSSLIT